jgi:predicted lipid-binding transport protein (Tim44 family)
MRARSYCTRKGRRAGWSSRARVEAIRIVSVDAAVPAAGVEVDARGRCYLEDRAPGRAVAGSRDRDSPFTARWTLALDGTGEWPWRIAAAAPLPLM